ncbi:MAG: hypothetical protein IJ886_08925 [Prevotella sp.]|nr:hypothetical protein [Prevotella sp.]
MGYHVHSYRGVQFRMWATGIRHGYELRKNAELTRFVV